MYISIIGTTGAGKSTLFRAVAGGAATANGNGSSIATIDVPDERVDTLTKLFNPRKTVYARITVADTVAIREGEARSETLDAVSLQQMRSSDALLLVLRLFDDGHPADPIGEFQTIQTELILSDMVQVEQRLERIAKQGRVKAQPQLEQEKGLLERCLAHLEAGTPLSTLGLDADDDKRLRGFLFLSRKPMMIVVNCAEDRLNDAPTIVTGLKGRLAEGAPVLAACGQLEAELASMASLEQAGFMTEYGIEESVRGRIICLARDTLGLISFLTVGDDECRAWPVRNGITAQEAAASIHTDLSRKFIRAETVSYDDFIRLDGFAGCKKAGLWRLEGKTYIVRDGDILSIRAGN